MTNNVNIVITGDSKEVEKALQKTQSELDKANMKLEKMKDKSGRATDEASKGFDRTQKSLQGSTAQLTGFIAKLGAAQVGVRILGDEWERQAARQKASLDATFAPAQSRRDAVFNFTPDESMGYEQLDATVRAIASDTNTPEAEVWATMSAALSAQGSQSNAVTANAVRDALRVKPGEGASGTASILAGRGLDLAKYTGSTDIGANLGFLANVQSAVRLEDPTLVGTNIIPAIGAGRAYGDTAEQSAEMMAAFSQLLGDTRGDQSSTAYQKLAGQLKNYVPKMGKEGLTGKDAYGTFAIPEEQFKAYQQAQNSYERMAAMRKSPELMRGFLGSASWEIKSREQSIAMLKGEAQATEELANAQGKILQLGKESRTIYEEKIGRMNAGNLQSPTTTKQAIEAGLERSKLEDLLGQRTATSRESLNKALESVDLNGIDFFTQKRYQAEFETRLAIQPKKPEEAATETLGVLLSETKSLRDQAKISKVITELENGAQRAQQAANPNANAGGAFWGQMRDKFGNDPQVDETNSLLRQLVDQGSGGSVAPRPTERPSAGLSRRN